MTYLTNALRGITTAALVGGFACLGATPASADPTDAFTGSLSKGYSSSNCWLASGFRGAVSIPHSAGGTRSVGKTPTAADRPRRSTSCSPTARTWPADSPNSLAATPLTNCGDAKSPTVWHQGSSTDSAGQVACGTDDGQAEVIWTTDAKNVLAFVRASNGDTPRCTSGGAPTADPSQPGYNC